MHHTRESSQEDWNDAIQSIAAFNSSGQSLLYKMSSAGAVENFAKGGIIESLCGRRFINWGGYGVFLLGHSNESIVSRLCDQAKMIAISSRAMPYSSCALLNKSIASILPPDMRKFTLMNTGSEAVEYAIKIARIKTGRKEVFFLEGAYHGKTMGALSVSDSFHSRGLLAGFDVGTRQVDRQNHEEVCALIAAHKPAAIIIEPVQGEGGIVRIRPDYLQAVRMASAESGTLLIFDEIQCGLGRTGAQWAHLESGASPDLLLGGKALGGGVFPVSLVAGTESAFGPVDADPLLHSSTFANSPLAASAVIGFCEEAAKIDIPSSCNKIGGEIANSLAPYTAGRREDGAIDEIRQFGALIGLKMKNPLLAVKLLRNLMKREMIVTPCLSAPDVIRITPPANSTEAEVQAGIAVLLDALDALQQ